MLEWLRWRLCEQRFGWCVRVWEVRGDRQKCERLFTDEKVQQALFPQGTQSPPTGLSLRNGTCPLLYCCHCLRVAGWTCSLRRLQFTHYTSPALPHKRRSGPPPGCAGRSVPLPYHTIPTPTMPGDLSIWVWVAAPLGTKPPGYHAAFCLSHWCLGHICANRGCKVQGWCGGVVPCPWAGPQH